jgi:hypothetical protein
MMGLIMEADIIIENPVPSTSTLNRRAVKLCYGSCVTP